MLFFYIYQIIILFIYLIFFYVFNGFLLLFKCSSVFIYFFDISVMGFAPLNVHVSVEKFHGIEGQNAHD